LAKHDFKDLTEVEEKISKLEEDYRTITSTLTEKDNKLKEFQES